MIPALTLAAGYLFSVFADEDQPAEARAFALIASVLAVGAAIGLFVTGGAA